MAGSLHVNLFKCLIHSRYVNSFWSTTFFMKSPASSFKWRNSKINLRSSKDVFPWQKLTPTSYAVGVLGSETDLLRSSLTVQFLGLELPRNRNPPLIFAVNLVFSRFCAHFLEWSIISLSCTVFIFKGWYGDADADDGGDVDDILYYIYIYIYIYMLKDGMMNVFICSCKSGKIR